MLHLGSKFAQAQQSHAHRSTTPATAVNVAEQGSPQPHAQPISISKLVEHIRLTAAASSGGVSFQPVNSGPGRVGPTHLAPVPRPIGLLSTAGSGQPWQSRSLIGT